MNLYNLTTLSCFHASASSSESLIFYLLKLQHQQGYKINKINRLECLYK